MQQHQQTNLFVTTIRHTELANAKLIRRISKLCDLHFRKLVLPKLFLKE